MAREVAGGVAGCGEAIMDGNAKDSVALRLPHPSGHHAPPVPDHRAHLELLHEVLPDSDARAGVAQNDLKVLLQCQPRSHVGQPLVGHGRQRRAGHPQQDHEPVATGALLRGVDEVLGDLQRLHRRVVLHLREAAHGHHSGCVVLHENKRPDHRAVQAGEPATNRQTRP